MRMLRLAAPLTVSVLVLATGACEDGASPTVDTSVVVPEGATLPTAPSGSDPQTTAAANPNAGAGGGAPAPTDGTSSP